MMVPLRMCACMGDKRERARARICVCVFVSVASAYVFVINYVINYDFGVLQKKCCTRKNAVGL